jgi:hypothetical protein
MFSQTVQSRKREGTVQTKGKVDAGICQAASSRFYAEFADTRSDAFSSLN